MDEDPLYLAKAFAQMRGGTVGDSSLNLFHLCRRESNHVFSSASVCGDKTRACTASFRKAANRAPANLCFSARSDILRNVWSEVRITVIILKMPTTIRKLGSGFWLRVEKSVVPAIAEKRSAGIPSQ